MSSAKRWKPTADGERKRLGSEEGWSHDGNSSISSASLLSRTRGKRVKVAFSPKVPRMLLENMNNTSDSPTERDPPAEESPPSNGTTLESIPEDGTRKKCEASAL